jgi:type II secretory pathway pseudopilin PulG
MSRPLNFHRGKNGRAFILLEVLLATAIFALVATALAISLNETIEASLRIRRDSAVRLNLESQLAEARAARLSPGKETAKPDDDGVIYEREVTALDLRNNKKQLLVGLLNVQITARWQENNRNETLSVQTYVLQQ